MSAIVTHFLLLADKAAWKNMGKAFSGEGAKLSSNEILILCLLGLGIVALISVIPILAKWTDPNRIYNSPRRLFRQLCNEHRLSRKDRSALTKLADYLELVQPALLFVQPDSFMIDDWPEELLAHSERLEVLHHRLFASEIKRPNIRPIVS